MELIVNVLERLQILIPIFKYDKMLWRKKYKVLQEHILLGIAVEMGIVKGVKLRKCYV